MKIVTLIVDGSGRLRVAATCAPDLLRRTVSTETGSARLVWCGVPPDGMGSAWVVAELGRRLIAMAEAPGVYRAGAEEGIRLVEAITRREARIRQVRRLVWRRLRALTGGIRRVLRPCRSAGRTA